MVMVKAIPEQSLHEDIQNLVNRYRAISPDEGGPSTPSLRSFVSWLAEATGSGYASHVTVYNWLRGTDPAVPRRGYIELSIRASAPESLQRKFFSDLLAIIEPE